MKNLWFPVKPALTRMLARALLALAGGPLQGCGYAAVYAGHPPAGSLAVLAGSTHTPNADAGEAMLAAAVAELVREGVTVRDGGYPRLVVELVRADEVPAGIVAFPGQGPTAGPEPRARGSTVGVTGRAWLEEREGGERRRSTGDLRRVETVATGATPTLDAASFSLALRTAARRVGEALARRVLGLPEPTIEPL